MTTTPTPSNPPGQHIHFPEVAWPAAPETPPDKDLGNVYPRPHGGRNFIGFGTAAPAASQPIGMIEPRPSLLVRLLPSTATAFWMAVSAALGFLLARAEGWL